MCPAPLAQDIPAPELEGGAHQAWKGAGVAQVEMPLTPHGDRCCPQNRGDWGFRSLGFHRGTEALFCHAMCHDGESVITALLPHVRDPFLVPSPCTPGTAPGMLTHHCGPGPNGNPFSSKFAALRAKGLETEFHV